MVWKKNKVKSLMDEVQNIDSDIVNIYNRFQIEDSDENYIKETDDQIGFMINVEKQLNEVSLKFKCKNHQALEGSKEVSVLIRKNWRSE